MVSKNGCDVAVKQTTQLDHNDILQISGHCFVILLSGKNVLDNFSDLRNQYYPDSNPKKKAEEKEEEMENSQEEKMGNAEQDTSTQQEGKQSTSSPISSKFVFERIVRKELTIQDWFQKGRLPIDSLPIFFNNQNQRKTIKTALEQAINYKGKKGQRIFTVFNAPGFNFF